MSKPVNKKMIGIFVVMEMIFVLFEVKNDV